SIGVAVTIPGIGMVNSEELVCAADDALYEAKNAGRDGWRFAAGIDPASSHHDAIPNQKGTV
ncbi:MAG: GGDEF domain-containing protein, partial [Moraxellaceae bacterium]|nr:GGDEF domain-containing protein [Moraxellaceae bacterium]